MSSDIAIKVENLSKCYQIYDTPRDRLKQFLVPPLCRLIPGLRRYFPTPDAPVPVYHREFWALKDVSFEIKKGETVGIIGRNGSGKSTLLQLICGTLNPTAGAITVNGRIAALLELGSGFNPEFTGRENVRLTCALLGLTPEETDQRFEEIAAFADIGEFIEQPVKTYSSGMFVRLAFAVNTLSDAPIQIIDEALAVGDARYQAKCLRALKALAKKGRTVLLVSHDPAVLTNICDRLIYMSDGLIRHFADPLTVSKLYHEETRKGILKDVAVPEKKEANSNLGSKKIEKINEDQKVEEFAGKFNSSNLYVRDGSGEAKVNFVELLAPDGGLLQFVDFNQEVIVNLYIECFSSVELSPTIIVSDMHHNELIGASWSAVLNLSLIRCNAGDRLIVTFRLRMPLTHGKYWISTELIKPEFEGFSIDKGVNVDTVTDAVGFEVLRRPFAAHFMKVYIETQAILKLVRSADNIDSVL